MSSTSNLSFTKLVVRDLDAMADYYCRVFGLHRATRARFEDGVGGEPIEELSLAPSPDVPFGTLTLLRFADRSAPPEGEVILGFTTDDLDALLDRVRAAGGQLLGEARTIESHRIRVAFARDPEGHLSELVELLS